MTQHEGHLSLVPTIKETILIVDDEGNEYPYDPALLDPHPYEAAVA